MPSTKDFLNYILEQLSGLEDITHRYMMREYILYYRGKIAGGIYDDRLLIKPVPSAEAFIKAHGCEPVYELPYAGGKEMLLIEEIDDRHYLQELFDAIYDELELPKTRKKKSSSAKKSEKAKQAKS